MKYTKEEIENAKASLKKWLYKGAAVYIVVKSVSASGMSRRMRFYSIGEKHHLDLTCWLSVVLGYPLNDKGLRLDGCGMDRGFHAIDNALWCLYGTGGQRPISANDITITYL